MPQEEALIKLAYLTSAVLFVFGLKLLSHPKTAVRGNLLASLAMLIAIVVTLTDHRIVRVEVIIAGFVVGGLVGSLMAYRAPMTAMPQVVAVFNGFGGGASALAVGAALMEALGGEWVEQINVQFSVSAAVAALIGAVAMTGSAVAFGKLQGWITEKPVLFAGRHIINAGLFMVCVGLCIWLGVDSESNFSTQPQAASGLNDGKISVELRKAFKKGNLPLTTDPEKLKITKQKFSIVEVENENQDSGYLIAANGRWLINDSENGKAYTVNLESENEKGSDVIEGRVYVSDSISTVPFWLLVGAAGVLGVLLVIPIGGADMPVVISLLNAYSGIAAAGHGWVLNNSVLIIAGSLVGAAGFILTAIMSKAMNRSLANIIFAGVGAEVASDEDSADIYATVKSAGAEEVAMLLEDAQRVVIAPGYGLAVAQAQFAVQELTKTLEEKGVEVEFAIHPVAGRMPGHMNVLLADANISYDKLKEMDEINPTFKQTDVVLVIGANDVVNPMARQSDPSIPIAGMPILDVDQAKAVVIIKRSLSPGFAGIANPLFAADNALMLFGDAKKMVAELTAAVRET